MSVVNDQIASMLQRRNQLSEELTAVNGQISELVKEQQRALDRVLQQVTGAATAKRSGFSDAARARMSAAAKARWARIKAVA